MNELDQLKAVAELDGLFFGPSDCDMEFCWRYRENEAAALPLKPYLHSRDAIVPVIEKQKLEIQRLTAIKLVKLTGSFEEIARQAMIATPAQLTEALLRATGRWVE